MQTGFTAEQLSHPDLYQADRILRKCVHCGFCSATCPTYQLLGDELDSPRGRIYLIKDMLENNRIPGVKIVKHIDRCLSCLSCVTTCPSGVDYMHLIDQARNYIEKNFQRPMLEKLQRGFLATVLPRPFLFRITIYVAKLLQLFNKLLPARIHSMTRISQSVDISRMPVKRSGYHATTASRGSVGLITGCVQQVIGNHINQATINVLTRFGFDVHLLAGIACCGAIEHHLGKEHKSLPRIIENTRNWAAKIKELQLDAIIVNASGCGTMIKDYAYILRNENEISDSAALVSNKALDITEFLVQNNIDPLPGAQNGKYLKVAYQNPCSMQHGQKITDFPAALLQKFGYQVLEPPESHICCGSAGTYNLLQPQIANQLGRLKIDKINIVNPDVIASGNLGCITQLSRYTDIPVVHTVQLLDWASGGVKPF